jgi:hypothetical protein
MVLAGRGRPATSGQYRNRYIWRRGLPREAESSLLSGRGGGGWQAALLPLPAAPGRLPEGGWVGKRSQQLRGAGRLTCSSPAPPHSNRSSTTFLPRWPAQGPPSHIFEPAAKAPLQLLLNNFKTEFSEMDLSCVLYSDYVDLACGEFWKKYSSCHDANFPLTKKLFNKKIHKRHPFMTQGLLISRNTKNKLHKIVTADPNPLNIQNYKTEI